MQKIVYALINAKSEIKLGRTNNIDRRMKALKTADPTISVLYTLEVIDDRKAEASLHAIFAAKRIHGEWFILDKNDLDLLHRIFTMHVDTNDNTLLMLRSLGLR